MTVSEQWTRQRIAVIVWYRLDGYAEKGSSRPYHAESISSTHVSQHTSHLLVSIRGPSFRIPNPSLVCTASKDPEFPRKLCKFILKDEQDTIEQKSARKSPLGPSYRAQTPSSSTNTKTDTAVDLTDASQ